MTDELGSEGSYIAALADVRSFVRRVEDGKEDASEIPGRYLMYTDFCGVPIVLFTAVIIYPECFNDPTTGLPLPEVREWIQARMALWHDMNGYFRNFMNLGINLVDRQTN